MCRSLAAAAVFLLSAGAASAADIYAGDAGGSLKDAPVYAVVNRAGFYGGTNSGAAWSQQKSELSVENFKLGALESTAAAHGSLSGAFGGGQIGYNWQRMNIVFGVEADFDVAGVHGKSAASALYGGTVAEGTAKSQLDYFGTLRGRLGFTAGPALIYGTGGFAFGGVDDELGATGIAGSGVSSNKTATGWVAGGGIEYALAPAVSVKAEYLHIDLGSTAINHPFSAASNVSASLTTHHDYDVVRGGVNYHLGENAPLGAAADIFAGFFNDSPGYALNRWSGFYAGWNSGSAWSEHQASLGVTAYQNGSLPVSSGAEYSPSGALGGGQIGFNWQQGRLVFGVEADADWSGVVDKGAAVAGTVPTLLPTSAAAATAKSELEYFGTLRGRAGYTFGRALIYGSGGFATGSVKDELSITNNASSGNATSAGSLSNSRTATGWAAGAGIEFALTPSWSLKTEYLHMDLGSTTVSQSAAAVPGSFSALANLTVHHDYDIVRGGWNYRLGTYEPLK